MKKKNWLFLVLILTAFGLGLFYFQRINQKHTTAKKPQEKQPHSNWQTFVKKGKKDISSHKTTSDEIKKEKLKTKDSKRKPASLGKKSLEKKNSFKRQNRLLIGEKQEFFSNQENSLEILNQYNKAWKSNLGHKLMRFQEADTKVFIRPLESLLQVKKGKGLLVEKVIIQFKLPSGKRSSFNALVDSESGKVLQTWNRTIHEGIGKVSNRMPIR
jgi:hypothetical protein